MKTLLDEIEDAIHRGDMNKLERLYDDEKVRDLKVEGRMHPLEYAYANNRERAAVFLLGKCNYVKDLDVFAMTMNCLSPNYSSGFLHQLIKKVGKDWKTANGASFFYLVILNAISFQRSDIFLRLQSSFVLSQGVSPLGSFAPDNFDALHIIARLKGYPLSTRYMCSLGIPYSSKSKDGTPYEAAKKFGNHLLIGLIEKKYADDSRAFSDFQLVNLALPSTKRLPPDIVRVVSEYVFILDIPQDDDEFFEEVD